MKRRDATFGLAMGLATGLVLGLAPPAAHADQDLLDPEVAFRLAARRLDERTAEFTFAVAPGHYLYRDRFRLTAGGKAIPFQALPRGTVKDDATFGRVETYSGELRIRAGLPAGTIELTLTSQGCSEVAGICYPPLTQALALPAGSTAPVMPVSATTGAFSATRPASTGAGLAGKITGKP